MKSQNINPVDWARRGAVMAVAVLLAIATLAMPATTSAQNNITVLPGTRLRVRIDTPIRSQNVRVGDPFRATVIDPVMVNNVEVIPDNTVLQGRVESVNLAKQWGSPSGVTLSVDQLVSPTGATANVVGTLTDTRGTPLQTVENLTAGTQVLFIVQRALTLNRDFFARGDDVINTPATIRQAQSLLNDLGYYTGPMNGQLTRPTRLAIAQFQRDQQLNQTGFLDRETLDRLGLISQSGGEVAAVTVISATAETTRNNQLQIDLVTQNARGMQVFEDHFRQNDTLHIYVRGFQPSASYRSTTDTLSLSLRPNEWNGLNRIVVHNAGQNIVIRADEFTGRTLSLQQAERLESEINSMLLQYASALGLRYNRFTGQITFSSRVNYRENETELLFALNSLAATSRLYTQLIKTNSDPQALAGATDLLVFQANAMNRAVSRTKSGRATQVSQNWTTMRRVFERLDNGNDADFGRNDR